MLGFELHQHANDFHTMGLPYSMICILPESIDLRDIFHIVSKYANIYYRKLKDPATLTQPEKQLVRDSI